MKDKRKDSTIWVSFDTKRKLERLKSDYASLEGKTATYDRLLCFLVGLGEKEINGLKP